MLILRIQAILQWLVKETIVGSFMANEKLEKKKQIHWECGAFSVLQMELKVTTFVLFFYLILHSLWWKMTICQSKHAQFPFFSKCTSVGIKSLFLPPFKSSKRKRSKCFSVFSKIMNLLFIVHHFHSRMESHLKTKIQSEVPKLGTGPSHINGSCLSRPP